MLCSVSLGCSVVELDYSETYPDHIYQLSKHTKVAIIQITNNKKVIMLIIPKLVIRHVIKVVRTNFKSHSQILTRPTEFSVLMPGEAIPTFIAQPAPVPCPQERVSWPTHNRA